MRDMGEIKTPGDVEKLFNLAANGETLLVSHPDSNIVILSQDEYNTLKNANYFNKIERAIKRVQSGKVIAKTMEELEAME